MNYILNIFWLLLLLLTVSQSPARAQALVAPSLTDEITQEGTAEMLIILREQADLRSAQFFVDKKDKGRWVYDKLIRTAGLTQKDLINKLDMEGLTHRSFHLVNAILFRGDGQILNWVRARPEVAAILANPVMQLSRVHRQTLSPARSVEVVPWGLELIGVPEVWEAGYTGTGAIVGGQDTGVEWDHPALIDSYRGWDGSAVDHNYHWHDAIREISLIHNDSVIDPSNNPCGLQLIEPCDDAGSSHGTHTMGTMVGFDSASSSQVGVAPGARWIAVRNMERGFGSPASYLESFEWFLAPTNLEGLNPDSDRAPHVINNSWSCPEFEGCNPENFTMLEQAINNLKAAGIMVVASAGNAGAGCRTINAPPAIFENSFTVGSVDVSDSISSFSSRGPVTVDFSFRIKPNVSAPGRGVVSAIKGGGYGALTGTSMAGPHVAGLVALMISANPELAGRVEVIEEIIERTAIEKFEVDTCMDISSRGDFPNALHGFGRIDAFAAVQAALQITPLQEISDNSKVSVYPNPASNYIYFEIAEWVEKISHINIYSSIGQLVIRQKVNNKIVTSELTALPNGLYFYQFEGGFSHLSGSFVKK
ncbi:MAG: S8 family peptidase [Saprospiraceae bacterium]|nr:S8 family peptidase [Saprospiraceae bacterium]